MAFNLLDRLFGIPDQPGLLGDNTIRQGRRGGLIGAGLGVLDASAPHPFKVQAGGILAAAIRGGQGGAQQGVQQGLAGEHQMALRPFAGTNDPESLRRLFSTLVAQQDYKGAGEVAQILGSGNAFPDMARQPGFNLNPDEIHFDASGREMARGLPKTVAEPQSSAGPPTPDSRSPTGWFATVRQGNDYIKTNLPVAAPTSDRQAPPNRQERGDAAYGVRAGVAERTLWNLEKDHAGDVRQAAIAINNTNFARAIPFLGVRSAAAAKSLRELGISDGAQEYLNSLIEFSQNAAPAQFTPGAMRSPEMLYNMWTEFGAQPGEGSRGWAIKHRNRQGLMRMTKFRAGDEAWQAALKEFKLTEDQLFDQGLKFAPDVTGGGLNPKFY